MPVNASLFYKRKKRYFDVYGDYLPMHSLKGEQRSVVVWDVCTSANEIDCNEDAMWVHFCPKDPKNNNFFKF